MESGHYVWQTKKAEVIHAQCLFCFAITALSSEKVVDHVFCHDSAAQQVVLCRGSLYSHSLFKAAAHVAPRGAAASVVVVGPFDALTCEQNAEQSLCMTRHERMFRMSC